MIDTVKTSSSNCSHQSNSPDASSQLPELQGSHETSSSYLASPGEHYPLNVAPHALDQASQSFADREPVAFGLRGPLAVDTSKCLQDFFTDYYAGQEPIGSASKPDLRSTAFDFQDDRELADNVSAHGRESHSRTLSLPFDYDDDTKDNFYFEFLTPELSTSPQLSRGPEHDELNQGGYPSSANASLDQHSPWGHAPSCQPSCFSTCVHANGSACMTSASKILKSLLVRPSACLSSTGRRGNGQTPGTPRAVDSALTTNVEAAEVVSDILECSCFVQPQLQLVVVTICAKLIAWYGAIVRGHFRNIGHQSASEVVTADRRHAERVLLQPITIGGHCVDGAMGGLLVGFVVLARLQEMETLVDKVSQHIRQANQRASSICEEDLSVQEVSSGNLPLGLVGLREVAHERILENLRAQLQGTHQELACSLGTSHVSATTTMDIS